MQKMRIGRLCWIRQFSAPDCFSGPSLGRFTDIPHLCVFSLPAFGICRIQYYASKSNIDVILKLYINYVVFKNMHN